IAALFQPLAEGHYAGILGLARLASEPSDYRHRGLLRPRRERPCRRRAAEQRDEMAASCVEHGLPSRNPLCQLTAGSGCLGSARRSLGGDLDRGGVLPAGSLLSL